ncbi:MAG TPA: TIGR03086 family metal-binding protein [Mycobacteriales bacterium]|nr:TIGR03086 family metal-binding protein [Mycobacteriales bacterium]
MIDLKPACDRMTDVLAGVADDQLAEPTPCAEYTVRDLIAHIDQVARGFAALARGRDEEPAGEDWRADAARNVRALGAAWDEPAAWRGSSAVAGPDLSNELWGKIAFTEIVVHGWDLARATGQPFELPEATVRACLDHVAVFVPNAPVPEIWGTVVTPPPDATLLEQVVAITGRDPRS